MSPHGAGGLLIGNPSQALSMGLGVRRQESSLSSVRTLMLLPNNHQF